MHAIHWHRFSSALLQTWWKFCSVVLCVVWKGTKIRQSDIILLSSIASKLLLTLIRIWSLWRIQIYKLQLCFVELHTLRYQMWINLVSFSGFSSKTLCNLFFVMKQLRKGLWNGSIKKNYKETLTVTSRKTLPGNYKLKLDTFTFVISANLVSGYLFNIGNFINWLLNRTKCEKRVVLYSCM